MLAVLVVRLVVPALAGALLLGLLGGLVLLTRVLRVVPVRVVQTALVVVVVVLLKLATLTVLVRVVMVLLLQLRVLQSLALAVGVAVTDLIGRLLILVVTAVVVPVRIEQTV